MVSEPDVLRVQIPIRSYNDSPPKLLKIVGFHRGKEVLSDADWKSPISTLGFFVHYCRCHLELISRRISDSSEDCMLVRPTPKTCDEPLKHYSLAERYS